MASIPSFGSTLDTAAAYTAAGLSVVAIKPDGSKRPPFTWGEFEQRHATDKELRLWFGSGRNGIGVICGAISGGLEVIDFDSDLFEQWRRFVEAEAPGLVERLPVVLTPGAGVHVFYRCTTIAGNQKLAVDTKRAVLIETRGEGGLVVAPGSPLTCHPAGKPYQLVRGDLRTIPQITPGEREVLLSVARSFNEYVASPLAVRAPAARQPGGGQRPGDAFNAKTTWADVLEPHGWRCVLERGQVGCWKRPGKDDVGWSATTNHAGSDLLYVFSSNAAPFEPERSYDRFAAYTMLQHGGDFRAAAKALSEQGYGDRPLEVDLRKPTQKTSTAEEAPLDELIDCRVLLRQTFAAPRYPVSGLLPEGLSILAGKPKQGKSMLALSLALAISTGRLALGSLEVDEGDVLYLALEDGDRRVQHRVLDMLDEDDPPAEGRLTFAMHWDALDKGGYTRIAQWIEAHPQARWVVVDTLVRVKPEEERGKGLYQQDYKAIAPLADLAHDHSVSITLITHLRKQESDDPMDLISGTLALAGAADGTLIMRRERSSFDAALYVFDRDAEDKTLALRWDVGRGGWNLLGPALDVKRSRERQEILMAIQELGGHAAPKEVAEYLNKTRPGIRQTMLRMAQAGLLVNAGGSYMATTTPPVTPVTAPPSTRSESL